MEKKRIIKLTKEEGNKFEELNRATELNGLQKQGLQNEHKKLFEKILKKENIEGADMTWVYIRQDNTIRDVKRIEVVDTFLTN